MQSDMHSGAQQDHDHDHHVGPPLEPDRRKLLHSLPRLFMRRSTVAVPGVGRGKYIPSSRARLRSTRMDG